MMQSRDKKYAKLIHVSLSISVNQLILSSIGGWALWKPHCFPEKTVDFGSPPEYVCTVIHMYDIRINACVRVITIKLGHRETDKEPCE